MLRARAIPPRVTERRSLARGQLAYQIHSLGGRSERAYPREPERRRATPVRYRQSDSAVVPTRRVLQHNARARTRTSPAPIQADTRTRSFAVMTMTTRELPETHRARSPSGPTNGVAARYAAPIRLVQPAGG